MFMKDVYLDLAEYIKKLEDYKLPDYKELPSIPLYMEQVVGYISEILDPICDSKEQIITPFMINNYVKGRIITPPEHKKYDKNHLGYLLAISLLKNVTSMKELASLIDMDKKFISDKQKLYNYFKGIQDEVIKNEAHKVKIRLDALSKKKETDEKSLMNLGYIALRLYIESETSKLIADSIMKRVLENSPINKEIEKEAKKEKNLELKSIETEANKLKNRK